MTIEEMTSRVRRHTYGLLNDGEVVYAVEMALQMEGGLEPDDVEDVKVLISNSNLEIQFILKEDKTIRIT
jgi:hypothetical protein